VADGTLSVSNSVTTTNVSATRYYGDGGLLSNISTLANLVVSNSVTTTNIFSNNLTLSNTVFIGNTFWTGTNSTNSVVGAPTRLVFDNTTTPYAANKILLHSNTASANICGFGVTGVYNTVPMTLSYYTSGGHSFTIGANQNFGGYEVFSINETGQFNFGGQAQQAKLTLGGSLGIPSNNTMMRIDSSNVALVTNGAGRVGFGTTAPTANLHVIGNVYASNAITTTNVFATRYYGDGGLLSNISTFTQPLANLVVSNSVTTTNVFANTMTLMGTGVQTTLYVRNNVFVSDTITKMFDNTSVGMYVGGGTISSTTSRAINTYSTSYPNFLATGGSTFYFNDVPVTTLADKPLAASDQAYCDMSADGNTVIMMGNEDIAYIYRFSGGSWDTGTTLYPPIIPFGLTHACAMSADGNTVIITTLDDTPWVFRFSNGSWDSGTGLTLQSDSSFGYSCAMSADGNTIIITCQAFIITAGYVYRFSDGSWDSGTALAGKSVTSFGQACAMSADGNTVIVTGRRNSGTTAYVYRFSDGSWDSGTALAGKSVTSFGQACAMSADGNTVIVTGLGSSTTAYVYHFSGGSWDSGTALSGKSDAYFGQACAMSADGFTITVTASNYSDGTIYVYRFSGGTWDSGTFLVKQVIPYFGFRCAMSADGNSIVTTTGDDLSGTSSPYVYVLGPRFNVNNTLNVYNGMMGIRTTSPSANLHVTGNIYASNSVTTTNVFATTANVGTLNVWRVSNLSTLTVTNNLYSANALTTTNVFAATETLTGTTGKTTSNITGNLYVSNAITTTNVFAATVSATNPISFRNRVINGDFLIDQRNAGASSTPATDPTRTIDRWKVNIFGSGRCQVGQNLGAFAYPAGFTSYYGMKVTTTTSVGANDYFFLSQVVEGVNTIDWQWGTASAKTVTLSFWVQSSIAGTAGGFVRNAGSSASNYTRSYPFTFTITNTLTWEYKTITIPGDTGTPWYTGQTDGVEFGIELWNGSTYQSAPGAWAAGNFTGPSGGTINYAGTLNSVMNITGVQIELGSVATQFERRLYNFELAACQRYYEPTIARLGGYHTTNNYLRSSVYFNTKKRSTASPVLTVISTPESNNLGSLNLDNSNFDGSSARILAQVTTTGDAFGQWSVSVDCEF
jgi:hypothetical protein